MTDVSALGPRKPRVTFSLLGTGLSYSETINNTQAPQMQEQTYSTYGLSALQKADLQGEAEQRRNGLNNPTVAGGLGILIFIVMTFLAKLLL